MFMVIVAPCATDWIPYFPCKAAFSLISVLTGHL